ncbi:MAG TPA: 50S ribosomal protein L21 [Clostridiales bacterium]|jgi:ribosomal protein L21|uniref:50S ribosomal protein L21 n=1 Tax=Candidatus Fimenecus sp. TaxID=3022888 RepID=UPI000EC423D2|nr:50S ribosomal protein L21 [Clostridiales bacterium]
MYAIVKTGGKQYKVTKGLIFETELLDAEVNSTVELEVVLAADDNGNVVAGNDAANAKVSATVVEHGKGKKINIFTYKAKKNIRKRQGHRQPYTKLKIDEITLG